jgi:PBSX family phage terminase large subunit
VTDVETPPRIEHRFAPQGGCLDLFLDRSPELLVSGPAGTGKSRACLEKLHFVALHNPGMRGLIVRKTHKAMTGSALVTFREKVLPEAIRTGLVKYYGGSGEKPAAYLYRNGSTIQLTGMDAATKIMSTEFDMIYVQEAIELTEDDWEALTTRLRNRRISFQQLIADTNPSTPTHWLKQRANEGKTKIIESRHEDNPTLVNPDGTYTVDGAEYIAKLDALSGPRFYRLRQGKWVAAEGVIYEDYDDAVHLIDPFPIPEEWPRWWAVDFGFIHPFVLQCWAEDPDGRLYLYREIYKTRQLVSDHARTILDIVAPYDNPMAERPADTPTWAHRTWIEPQPASIVTDHDAEGRATLEDELGLSTDPAHKAVKEGIEKVQLRLRDPGDGRPRIFLFRDCVVEVDQSQRDAKLPTCTAEEIPGYVWGDKAKEGPVKYADDGCDTMRYVVAEVDLGARPNFRSFDE